MNEHREKLGNWVVRDKYFKQKSPNFLTWAEKEQIRYLYEKDTEEWTPERLSDCFPVDAIRVRKLLKAKWSPLDEKRVKRHDEKAKENWERFKNGELDTDLDYQLKKHLTKFIDREIDLSATPKFEVKKKYIEMIKTRNNEFRNIITNCKKPQISIGSAEFSETSKKANDQDMKQIEMSEERFSQMQDHTKIFNSKNVKMKKEMTYSDLKKLIDSDNKNQPQEIELQSTDIEIKSPENPAGTGIVLKSHSQQNIDDSLYIPNKYQPNRSSTDLDYAPQIKEYIKIPMKLYKKGGTYKLGDCFYDDDGELLYRVPGLTCKN